MRCKAKTALHLLYPSVFLLVCRQGSFRYRFTLHLDGVSPERDSKPSVQQVFQPRFQPRSGILEKTKEYKILTLYFLANFQIFFEDFHFLPNHHGIGSVLNSGVITARWFGVVFLLESIARLRIRDELPTNSLYWLSW